MLEERDSAAIRSTARAGYGRCSPFSRRAHYRQGGQDEGDEQEAAERPRDDPHARPSDRLRGAEALRPRAHRLCCCQKPTGAAHTKSASAFPLVSGLPTMRSPGPVHYTPYNYIFCGM